MEIKETKDYGQFTERTPKEREEYLISEALYLRIKHILCQPPERMECNDMWDILDLLNEKYPIHKGFAKQMDPDFDEVMKLARRPPDLKRVK